jgi:hypothetical protein
MHTFDTSTWHADRYHTAYVLIDVLCLHEPACMSILLLLDQAVDPPAPPPPTAAAAAAAEIVEGAEGNS